MIRITNELDGKKYELVPEIYICGGCDIKNKCDANHPEREDNIFNGFLVCEKLNGIWKEVRDGAES
jgi:hypothetical protein